MRGPRLPLMMSSCKGEEYPGQGFLGGSAVKNLPAMQETQDLPFNWEDLLEKGMASHSSILAWESPWKEEPGWLQSMVSQRVGHDGSD